MGNKYDVVKHFGHPVTRGGTNENGQAYEKESYDRGKYTEEFTRTTSRTGSSVQHYHDKELKDDD